MILIKFLLFLFIELLCSHKSCRCIRCFSRYGYLGAKTRENYTPTLNTSFNTNSTPKKSKSNVNSRSNSSNRKNKNNVSNSIEENQNSFTSSINGNEMSELLATTTTTGINGHNESFIFESEVQDQYQSEVSIPSTPKSRTQNSKSKKTLPSSPFLPPQTPPTSSLPPQAPIVVLESTCTMSDHLKVRYFHSFIFSH